MGSNLDFLTQIEDPELRQEIRNVLAQLQLLSESRAIPVGHSSPSSEVSLGPPEFRGLGGDDCPTEDRSLYEYYLWQFRTETAKARSKKRLWFLLWEAEHALKTRAVPPTTEDRAARMALVLNRPDEEKLAEYILENHEGEHAYKVQLAVQVPQGWIEKVREDAGRDPDLGELRPTWRDLTDEEKRAVVRTQKQRGRTQKEVARALGVGQRTIKTFWPKKAA